jgi:hypothetical protein
VAVRWAPDELYTPTPSPKGDPHKRQHTNGSRYESLTLACYLELKSREQACQMSTFWKVLLRVEMRDILKVVLSFLVVAVVGAMGVSIIFGLFLLLVLRCVTPLGMQSYWYCSLLGG